MVDLEADSELDNTHPVVALENPKTHRRSILEAYFRMINGKRSSYLAFIDGENGAVQSRILYSGAQHFSMPLVIDRSIYLATVQNGIQRFSWRSH